MAPCISVDVQDLLLLAQSSISSKKVIFAWYEPASSPFSTSPRLDQTVDNVQMWLRLRKRLAAAHAARETNIVNNLLSLLALSKRYRGAVVASLQSIRPAAATASVPGGPKSSDTTPKTMPTTTSAAEYSSPFTRVVVTFSEGVLYVDETDTLAAPRAHDLSGVSVTLSAQLLRGATISLHGGGTRPVDWTAVPREVLKKLRTQAVRAGMEPDLCCVESLLMDASSARFVAAGRKRGGELAVPTLQALRTGFCPLLATFLFGAVRRGPAVRYICVARRGANGGKEK